MAKQSSSSREDAIDPHSKHSLATCTSAPAIQSTLYAQGWTIHTQERARPSGGLASVSLASRRLAEHLARRPEPLNGPSIYEACIVCPASLSNTPGDGKALRGWPSSRQTASDVDSTPQVSNKLEASYLETGTSTEYA